MNYTIYLHRNKINGKIYIGQTSEENINRRFRGGHGYKSSPHFYHAIQEYGWDNFEHVVLEQKLSSVQADLREKYWIKIFNSTNPNYGYNLTPGGKTKPIGGKNKINSKSVYCKETGEKFDSLVDAAVWAGMKKESASNITSQIAGKKISAGKHPVTGEALHWCYNIKDINKSNQEKKKPGAKKVKNIDTGEIFNSINDAAKCYNVSNVTISKSCKSNGIIPVGKNKKYRWIFLN